MLHVAAPDSAAQGARNAVLPAAGKLPARGSPGCTHCLHPVGCFVPCNGIDGSLFWLRLCSDACAKGSVRCAVSGAPCTCSKLFSTAVNATQLLQEELGWISASVAPRRTLLTLIKCCPGGSSSSCSQKCIGSAAQGDCVEVAEVGKSPPLCRKILSQPFSWQSEEAESHILAPRAPPSCPAYTAGLISLPKGYPQPTPHFQLHFQPHFQPHRRGHRAAPLCSHQPTCSALCAAQRLHVRVGRV